MANIFLWTYCVLGTQFGVHSSSNGKQCPDFTLPHSPSLWFRWDQPQGWACDSGPNNDMWPTQSQLGVTFAFCWDSWKKWGLGLWGWSLELLAAILLLQRTEMRDEKRKTKSWYFLSFLVLDQSYHWSLLLCEPAHLLFAYNKSI